MIYSLSSLGHDAIIGCDDQYGDIGRPGAAGAHGGERFMAGCIQKSDQCPLVHHLIGADMLGDPSGFPGLHIALADNV